MIVKHLDDVIGTAADVDTAGWNSRRLIYANAGVGYSVNDTLIKPGTEHEFEYKNHFETVYCIEGRGEIVDLGTGVTHPIRPGTLYCLNRHDRHILRANQGTHMRMVCVFNPPLTGREVHDATGAYALADSKAPA
ncbi:ectoine synthase [Aquabacterium sp. A08]|uniref:ectoine synthase n=1 Tax=Aquabacterium sp. A08 TaxID=2718532 RepID=UPI00142406B9|nr:ectoine synthase [Aquabacterium sp. A08]NIC40024.1 ectoine synthase [Aquabacterium sp. A08]